MIDVHCHIFNKHDVPDDFLYVRLNYKNKLLTKLSKLLDKINPFTDRDIGSYLSNFVDTLNKETSAEIYYKLRDMYPKETILCPLSMDMRYFSKDTNLGRYFSVQLEELAKLKELYPDLIYPFLALDPRNKFIEMYWKRYIRSEIFKGIKIYPSLGYLPGHPDLMPYFKECEEKKIPITAHCSLGAGVEAQGGKFKDYNDPNNWIPVLEKYPNLYLNLAHFGGGSFEAKLSIINLMEKYPNVYTDTSFQQVSKKNVDCIYSFFKTYKVVQERLLFGSDFYMSLLLKDFNMSLDYVKTLFGEDFLKISEENPRKFLNIK